MVTGISLAWDTLLRKNPHETTERAAVQFDSSTRTYHLPCLGVVLLVSLPGWEIHANTPESVAFLNRHGAMLELPLLNYLIEARDQPLAGSFVNPRSLKSGSMFSQGTHVLPLDKLAQKYNAHGELLIQRAVELGGSVLGIGDVSIQVFPLPRVPVAFVL